MASFLRSLDDVVGHRNVITFLKKRLEKNTVPQKILLVGVAGLGKTSIAKLLAIALNGNDEKLCTQVIDNDVDADCIKLYTMSVVRDDTDKLVEDMRNISFSTTGKKVLILDEVHRMTPAAQDAILVNLDYLDPNVYIFMCTTEETKLSESLKSRMLRLNLNNLNTTEIKQVIKRKILERNLSFEMTQDMVLNTIANWANNQPRQAINLIETFEPNQKVTREDLATFIETNNVPIIISFIDYMYGSLILGVEFIDSISISEDLLRSFLEVLKVALGYRSPLVSYENTIVIHDRFSKFPLENFQKFTLEINSRDYITKRVMITSFMKFHIQLYGESLKPTRDLQQSQTADLSTIATVSSENLNAVNALGARFNRELEEKTNLDDFFEQGSIIKGD